MPRIIMFRLFCDFCLDSGFPLKNGRHSCVLLLEEEDGGGDVDSLLGVAPSLWETLHRELHTHHFTLSLLHLRDRYFKSPLPSPKPRFKLVETFHATGGWQDGREVLLYWALSFLGRVHMHLLRCCAFDSSLPDCMCKLRSPLKPTATRKEKGRP